MLLLFDSILLSDLLESKSRVNTIPLGYFGGLGLHFGFVLDLMFMSFLFSLHGFFKIFRDGIPICFLLLFLLFLSNFIIFELFIESRELGSRVLVILTNRATFMVKVIFDLVQALSFLLGIFFDHVFVLCFRCFI